MSSVTKLISAGISTTILIVIISQIIVPIIEQNPIKDITGAATLNAILQTLPILLGIAGFLVIVRLFSDNN